MEIDIVVVVGAYCFRGGGGGGTICGTTEPVEALGGYLGCILGSEIQLGMYDWVTRRQFFDTYLPLRR